MAEILICISTHSQNLFVTPFRQYREQLRLQRQQPAQPQQPTTGRLGYLGLNGSAPAINGSSSQLSTSSQNSDLSTTMSEKLHINTADVSTNNEVNSRFKSFDMKAMQKEAVLSYVKVRSYICVYFGIITGKFGIIMTPPPPFVCGMF